MKPALLSLRDVAGRGGPNFVYRIVIEPSERPDFRLTLLQDRVHIPQAGYGIVHVRADRAGYQGPIRLSVPGLPDGVAVSSSEIDAGATDTLLTLHAPIGWAPAQVLAQAVGQGDDATVPIRRLARLPETPVTRKSPWLRSALGVAITGASPITIAWDTTDATLPIGGSYPAKVKVTR